MSGRAEDLAWEACESTLRAIDASLSTLVLARENVVAQMQGMAAEKQQAAIPEPDATMGQTPDPNCTHPEGRRLDLGSAQLCDVCGAEVPRPEEGP